MKAEKEKNGSTGQPGAKEKIPVKLNIANKNKKQAILQLLKKNEARGKKPLWRQRNSDEDHSDIAVN